MDYHALGKRIREERLRLNLTHTSMNLLVQLMHDRTQEEKTLAINLLKVLFANK